MAQKLRTSKKTKKILDTGVVHIHSTFNNTIVTITNLMGDTVAWASAGNAGFKGARKGTPFAAQTAAEKVALEALSYGLKSVKILIKGQDQDAKLLFVLFKALDLKLFQLKILLQSLIMDVVLQNDVEFKKVIKILSFNDLKISLKYGKSLY